jgi:mevalonate kinase
MVGSVLEHRDPVVGEWSAACGKTILFGEHAVVYGVRAIAAGISRGVRARSQFGAADVMYVDGAKLDTDHPLLAALASMREYLGVIRKAEVELQSDLPQGAGLGSSAAMAVATARALALSHQLELDTKRTFEAAQAWERVFHGTPSGVDVAAAQSNSLIGFQKGSQPEPLLLARPMHLVVVQAGPPASTKQMVELVARHQKRHPIQFEKNLQAIASLAENAALLLRQGDFRAVGKLMDFNHMLLAGWMLSTEEIETAVDLARRAGALGAKLTGAGGGGCVVALAEDEHAQQTILESFSSKDMPAFPTNVGAPS